MCPCSNFPTSDPSPHPATPLLGYKSHLSSQSWVWSLTPIAVILAPITMVLTPIAIILNEVFLTILTSVRISFFVTQLSLPFISRTFLSWKTETLCSLKNNFSFPSPPKSLGTTVLHTISMILKTLCTSYKKSCFILFHIFEISQYSAKL